MIPKTGMTLDMYRWQAGLKTDAAARPNATIPLERAADDRFGQVLDAATSFRQPATGNVARGATLADYRRRQTAAASALFSNSTLHSGKLGSLAPRPFDSVSYASEPTTDTAAVKPSEDTAREALDRVSADANDRVSIQQGIEDAARKYSLPSKLISSVIQAESSFRADAVSPAGAQGLMQLMPATARELGVTDPFDVKQNIDGGARYLRQMLDRFGGDLKVALAAYNAGPGTVQKYDGDVPYRETRNYVRKVLAGMGATNPSQA